MSDVVHMAICDDDRCSWKHRGPTAEATIRRAVEHARYPSGHGVTVYADDEATLHVPPEPDHVPYDD